MEFNNTEMILYRTEDGITKIQVRMEEETVWLTQQQMGELFQTSKQNIAKHIKHIFLEGELQENSVVNQSLTTATDGKRYRTNYYNLDMIIAVGYRVRSNQGTAFRIWATNLLKEYIVKGFTMNDELLKEAGGGNYWKELLARIRDIRSSEKVMYRQLLDLFATSIDYNKDADEAQLFFKIVQNKLHYAVNLQTSAELIYDRADADAPFMGLHTFPYEQPRLADAKVAKNYLDEKELQILNRLVSAFFELAELHALNHEHMYMKDWIPQVDDFAQRYGKGVLQNAGHISHKAAIEKATEEYRKYKARIAELLSQVERDYLSSIKEAQKKIEKK